MTNPQENGIELVNSATEETGPRLERVNIMASGEMLGWLDSVSSTMYRKTGVRVSRSEILRGICSAFADHKPQFTGCHSEAHIRTLVGRLFQVYAQHAKANPPTPRPPKANGGDSFDEYMRQRASLADQKPHWSGRVYP
jgi:hypothetical protein